MQLSSSARRVVFSVVGACAFAAAGMADVIDEAQKSFVDGDYQTAVTLAAKEIKQNPGHEEAYVLLAQAHEKRGEQDEAAKVWQTLKTISRLEERISLARLGVLRTRGPHRPAMDDSSDDESNSDPFHVPVGRLDLERLRVVDDFQYEDSLPPFYASSRNFHVYACNQALADKACELCETYLAFLLERFLDGRAWARRIPVLFYKDHSDYVSVGQNPEASGGVTALDHFGRSSRVSLFMLDDDGAMTEDLIIGTLPHELTHVVIGEFFGAQDTPRWLHEAIARRMEQTRNHYEEAAKTGRDVVAGEYYRLRDLFAAEEYPDGFFRVWRFYEQSATIVLYLLEQGPESMLAFLQALRDGKGHDEAVAAALGIPAEGAVEQLEKRWVEWMKERFVHDLSEEERHEAVLAGGVTVDLYGVGGTELDTANEIEDWNGIRTDSLDMFRGIGDSLKDWSIAGPEKDRMVFDAGSGVTATVLGIRMNEEPPMVLRCRVRYTGDAGETGLFGVGMLDHRGDDTGIQVLVPLDDNRPHTITCVINEDIAIYLGDECAGRAPALRIDDIDEDIDYPLSFIAYSPVEVFDVETAPIEKFATASAD